MGTINQQLTNFTIKEFNKRLKQPVIYFFSILYFTIKEFNKRLKLASIKFLSKIYFTIKEFNKRLKHLPKYLCL